MSFSYQMVTQNPVSQFTSLLPINLPHAWKNSLGISQLESLYQRIESPIEGTTIASRLLDSLQVSYRLPQRDEGNIPGKGAAVVVVNHPFGILEGAVLLELFRKVRTDVKFLANGILSVIPELKDWVIAVDPMGNAARANRSGMKRAMQHLQDSGLLIVFPSGEVSHFQPREMRVSDPKWNPAVARLIQLAERRNPGLTVVPAHVEGANSLLFQTLGAVHPRLRTAMLVRELLNKKGQCIEIRIGSPIRASKLASLANETEQIEYLRWRSELLSRRESFKPHTKRPFTRSHQKQEQQLQAPIAQHLLKHEIDSLPQDSLLAQGSGLTSYIATSEQIPNILAEIGRLREVTFRTVGEGTGRSTDIDEFDAHYLHLFVWNAAKQEVAGAYRLARTNIEGMKGLYTSTLFKYDEAFLQRMGPAIELGRSWVGAEYQKSFGTLLMLWKGIGKFVARNPRNKVLFGPVSISNQYQSLSRQLMVTFLERYAWFEEWKDLVSTRNPLRISVEASNASFLRACPELEDLAQVVSDIEPGREGVPVLLRQYLKLGGKLLGFNVDPEFFNALDGLIIVDLTKTEPKLLERYLGKNEAVSFLEYQNEMKVRN